MTDAELWSAWRVWMAVAGGVVLIAAALLVTILVTARRILAEATRALAAADKIRGNTQVIWALQSTNEVAGGMLATVERLAARGSAVAVTVQGSAVGGHHAG